MTATMEQHVAPSVQTHVQQHGAAAPMAALRRAKHHPLLPPQQAAFKPPATQLLLVFSTGRQAGLGLGG